MQHQSWTTEIAVPARALYDWHARPAAFHRLTAGWDDVRVLERTGVGLEVGVRLTLRMRQGIGPIRPPVTWVAEHVAHTEGEGFVDAQRSGPFASWRHTHRFEAIDAQHSRLTDAIDYKLPLGALGQAVAGGWIRRSLERTFRHRHAQTRADLERLARYQGPPLTVAVTGASGLVGGALCTFLEAGGHRVIRYDRKATGPGFTRFDADKGLFDAEPLDGCDALVHLAGAPVAGRWTAAHKRAIRDSRVLGTQLVAEAVARCAKPPPVVVSASAIGFYGDTGERWVDEQSPSGDGFLAEVGRAWEAAALPMRDAGVRLVQLRVGLVLAASGGLLPGLLPVFSLGLGGPAGTGQQGQSWIHLDDLVGAIWACILDKRAEGPINGVAPGACAQRTFAHTLGRVIRRPAIAPAPAFALRALLGEAADGLVLEGQYVRPSQLEALGFAFRFRELEPALRDALGRW